MSNTNIANPVMPQTLDAWVQAAWQCSKDHGWHDVEGDGTAARVPERIALLHSECSELLEAFRNQPFAPCDKPIPLSCAGEELADIALRLFDFTGEFKLSFEVGFLELYGRRFETLQDCFKQGTEACECHPSGTPCKPASTRIADLHSVLSHLRDTTEEFLKHPTVPYDRIAACEDLANAFLDVIVFAADQSIDLQDAITIKYLYNLTRAHRHGGKQF